jgi:HD-GYP domain-containing protein (c-di-GMP phosphodiesterase class II)
MPELVDAFLRISDRECVWLDTMYNPLLTILPSMMIFDTMELTLDEVIELTEIFANLIDFRSPFTAKHSLGVAAVAERLAELVGFSENECKMMLCGGQPPRPGQAGGQQRDPGKDHRSGCGRV